MTANLPDAQKRGYSDEELTHLYELGRFSLENGDIRRAEAILIGVSEIAPSFVPAWLGLCAIHHHNQKYDAALSSARQAIKGDPDSIEAMLYLICSLLTTGDFNSAGSYLGEVGERIEAGRGDNPYLLRFYKAQLARYQNR